MKDNVDDRMRYQGTQLTGVMPQLGMSMDNLCNTYVQFFNSTDKVERIRLLNSLRLAALDAQVKAKQLIEFFGGNVFEGPLPTVDKQLDKRVQYAIKYSQPGLDVGESMYLHGAYLQLTQLGKRFVGIKPTPFLTQKGKEELALEVIQYLFQMHNVCNDIAELCLITKAEPDKKLEESKNGISS
jgi:hypothetical protein